MRPIERGNPPLDEEGNEKTYSRYQNARGDLINNLGQYCSYCETRLNASLAVEHVQPKDLKPELELEWSNFLLGCTNCNSTKSVKSIKLEDYFWADTHNTFIPFVYLESGIVTINGELTDLEKIKTANMIELVGLDKTPTKQDESDRRWTNRKEVWEVANRTLTNLNDLSNDIRRLFIELLVDAAKGYGFWSIWMHVFEEHNDVKIALIKGFKGTHEACFDENDHYKPIKRIRDVM